MARIFVPTGFEAAKVSPDLYLFLHTELPDDLYVLLEFHSKGHRQRQIDLAVLGPYGIDVVEVKAKVGGAVLADPNGPWHIRRDDGQIEAIPLNGAARENPYAQASNTAGDFKGWLESELGIFTKVFPLVLVPQGRRDSNLRNRGYVWTANGLDSFRSSLRSQRPYRELPESLTPALWDRIVNGLGLSELASDVLTLQEVQGEAKSPTVHVVEALPPLPHPTSVSKAPSAYRQHEDPPAPPPTWLEPARRSPWPTAFVGVVIAALLLGFGWMWMALAPDRPAIDVAAPPPESAVAVEAIPTVEPEAPERAAEPTSPDALEAAPEALPGVAYDAGSRSAQIQGGEAVQPSGALCPASHPVKGNINRAGERIFHLEGQAYYEVTDPEVCFASAEAAAADGFRASLR